MTSQRPRNQAPLESNHRVRLTLIRELAQGKQVAGLARKYGVTKGAVQQFEKRHKEEVDAAKADLTNEFHGLWIADKAARLAEYERDITLANELIEEARAGRIAEIVKLRGDRALGTDATHELEVVDDITPAVARAARIKHRALHQSAEELGQLPSRVQVNIGGKRVEHIVKGVDMDEV